MSPEAGLHEAHVTVRHGPLAEPVLGRVVGMLAARADCPIDRLDDALLIADAVAARAASFTDDGRINVLVRAQAGVVELTVGPLRARGAAQLIASAELPLVGNVLERIADELAPMRADGDGDGDGDGAVEHLRIRMAFASGPRERAGRPEQPDVL